MVNRAQLENISPSVFGGGSFGNLMSSQISKAVKKVSSEEQAKSLPSDINERIKGLKDKGATDEQINTGLMTKYGVTLDKVQPTQPVQASEEEFGSKTLGMLKGFGKGVLSTATKGSELFQTGVSKLTGGYVPAPGSKELDPRVGKFLEEAATARNTPERIGKTVEQIAEFFIPGGAAVKFGKGLVKYKTVSKLPKALQSIIKFGGTAGTEALTSGGITATQTGEVGKEAGIAAAIGAASPVAGAVTGKLKNLLFGRAVPTTLGQSAKDIAMGTGIGEAVSETGISLTRKGLAKKVEKLTSSLGKTLGFYIEKATEKKPGAVYQMDDITKGLKEELLSSPKTAKLLKATPIDMPKVEQVMDEVINDYKKLYKGKSLTLNDVQKLKVQLGQGLESEFNKALGATMKTKPYTEMGLRGKLKTIIEENVPEAAELNKKLAPLMEARGRFLKKGNYSQYLTDVLAGGFFAGGYEDFASNPSGYLKNLLKGVLLKRGLTSTAAKTITGTLLKDLTKPGTLQGIRKLFEEEK